MGSPSPTGAKARIPNPALEPLEFLVGLWRTEGTHPMVPGEILPGRTSFDWHEGGAFLVMRSEVGQAGFPDGVAIIGSSDAGRFAMLYFDERGVSRIYEVSVGDRRVTWRRDDPDFSQSTTIAAEGDRLVGTGRMTDESGRWVDDLSQLFVREGSSP